MDYREAYGEEVKTPSICMACVCVCVIKSISSVTCGVCVCNQRVDWRIYQRAALIKVDY